MDWLEEEWPAAHNQQLLNWDEFQSIQERHQLPQHAQPFAEQLGLAKRLKKVIEGRTQQSEWKELILSNGSLVFSLLNKFEREWAEWNQWKLMEWREWSIWRSALITHNQSNSTEPQSTKKFHSKNSISFFDLLFIELLIDCLISWNK